MSNPPHVLGRPGEPPELGRPFQPPLPGYSRQDRAEMLAVVICLIAVAAVVLVEFLVAVLS